MTDRQRAPDDRAAGSVPDPHDSNDYEELEARLRRSESLLAEVEQLTHIGSYEMTIGGTTLASEGLRSILGFSQAGQPFDLDEFYAHVHPEDRERVRHTIEESISGGRPVAIVYRFIRPDGSERSLESRGKLVLDEAGWPHTIIGMVQDITERVETERLLRDEREEAKRANRAKSELLSRMG